jgi:hypothetical protein
MGSKLLLTNANNNNSNTLPYTACTEARTELGLLCCAVLIYGVTRQAWGQVRHDDEVEHTSLVSRAIAHIMMAASGGS